MRRTILAALLLGGAAVISPASAVTINVGNVGATGVTAIQGIVDPGPVVVPGLTGTLGITYEGVTNSGKTWNFNYTVTNTSSGAVTGSRISSFGFGTTPDVAPGNAASTGLFNLALDPTNGFPNVGGAMAIIEMCFSAGNNSCSGGGGVTEGNSASGTFSLTFSSALNSISLDAALFRFQDIVSPGFADSGVGINSDPQITTFSAVPGPIVGAGVPGLVTGCLTLLGLGRWRRKRNQLVA
jgi:hypothetical protein